MSTELETVRLCSKVTPRQEANRKNAKKSTGPRTTEGKEASSQNALKHGLCANRNVIRTESQEEYNIFRDEMIADVAPAGAMELMLAERIVSLSWRLKRAEHFQNAAMNALIERDLNDSGYGWNDTVRHQARDEAAEGDFDLILGITVNIDFSRNKILEQLLAYEHRIENSLYRAIAELKKMQEIRREQKLKSLSDTQNEEMIDERRGMMDETREMMDEGIETRNKQVLKNEANLNENSEFSIKETEYEIEQHGLKPILQTGPALSKDKDYAAKQTQFDLDQRHQTQDHGPETNDYNNAELLQN
jgi:hypothetical protein